MHCLVYLVLATIIEQSVSHFLIFNNFSLIFPDFLRLVLTSDQWERQHRDGTTGMGPRGLPNSARDGTTGGESAPPGSDRAGGPPWGSHAPGISPLPFPN